MRRILRLGSMLRRERNEDAQHGGYAADSNPRTIPLQQQSPTFWDLHLVSRISWRSWKWDSIPHV